MRPAAKEGCDAPVTKLDRTPLHRRAEPRQVVGERTEHPTASCLPVAYELANIARRANGCRLASRLVDAERGVGVTSANIKVFFLTVFVLALLVLAFLLAAPVFAGSS
jgi:hypothetical protein